MSHVKTFFLGGTEVPQPALIKEIRVPDGKLFKEMAAEALWANKGHHLYLDSSNLPLGVSLLDTLIWLDQEAPPDSLLFFPLLALHPSLLPNDGPWVPVVQCGQPPLSLYYLLLEIEPLIRGVAIQEDGFTREEVKLLLDPFTEKKGAFSYFSFDKENYIANWRNCFNF